jgi:hypothetical protein
MLSFAAPAENKPTEAGPAAASCVDAGLHHRAAAAARTTTTCTLASAAPKVAASCKLNINNALKHSHKSTPIASHTASYLLPAGDVLELLAWPHTKDGADSEVGVHDAAAVQGVKGHAEALTADINGLWHLLGASVLAHVLRVGRVVGVLGCGVVCLRQKTRQQATRLVVRKGSVVRCAQCCMMVLVT